MPDEQLKPDKFTGDTQEGVDTLKWLEKQRQTQYGDGQPDPVIGGVSTTGQIYSESPEEVVGTATGEDYTGED